MTKHETPENTTMSDSNSTISALDRKSITPIDPATNSTEKSDVEQTDTINETPQEEIKRKKKEKAARILTFLGLQISLFLAALDG
jgi:hypothetical protein